MLSLWIVGRAPTTNKMLKAHPQTRGKQRRDWRDATEKAMGSLTTEIPLPHIDENGLTAWKKADRAGREAFVAEHGELLRSRCFGRVEVTARPWHPDGRSVPDPDGISLAAKWSLDWLTENAFLVTDTRHHVDAIHLIRARIEPMIDGVAMRLVIEAA